MVALTYYLLPLAAVAQTSPGTSNTTRGVVEQRVYTAENGRRIRITSLGNLIGLESPAGYEHLAGPGGAREGYVLGYVNPLTGSPRVVYNVNDMYSAVLGGPRDLIPQTFRAPADGTFPINTLVSATAVVDTSDGLLRLTHEFSWRAGNGKVTITTTVTNRSGRWIDPRGFKRHAAIDVDGHGRNGRAVGSDWKPGDRAEEYVILAFTVCGCPTPGPPEPMPGPGWAPTASHVFSMAGAPLPSYRAISPRGQFAEVTSAEYQPGSDLPGIRRLERNSGTLGWRPETLAPGGSSQFTTEYAVQ